jgi:hypothetical protein
MIITELFLYLAHIPLRNALWSARWSNYKGRNTYFNVKYVTIPTITLIFSQ